MSRSLLMTADAVGGVWQYSVELAAALRAHGWVTRLALLGPAPTDAQRGEAAAAGADLIETGLPLDWLADGPAPVLAAGEAIAALAERSGADLVQLNQPALAAVPRRVVPRLVAMHSCVATWWRALGDGPAPQSFGWQTDLVSRGLAAADALVCPSAAFAAEVTIAYRLPAPPAVVHNGRRPIAATSGALHDFALTCGRLWDVAKNAATLDRAAARLGVPFKAVGALAGPNGERIELEHLHPLGSVDQATLGNCLAARPVFVSAARYEPFGLAVLEGAQAGCPLVLSDIPTHRELWDGVATFVDPLDADGFAREIEALIGDVRLRLARGDLARRHAARFTPTRTTAEMAALYAKLLGAGRQVAA